MAEMHEYYATRTIRPTFADFSGDAELSAYADLRRRVFHRLMLPPMAFAGKRVLEFGPDTGENSLIFARWGARMTLVEPGEEAHAQIRQYFDRFGLDDRLEELVGATVLDYKTEETFDVIDAEGFIYALKPHSAWIDVCAARLEPDGFLVISYMELYGSFFELLLKAIYQCVVRDGTYSPGLETTKLLFLPKWNSISHTRRIDSWFMDVIENPFARAAYCIEPAQLLRDARAGGFRLYSAWPNYRNTLAMRWIKSAETPAEELASSIAFIEQSRLSHFLGIQCFLSRPSAELTGALRRLVEIVDQLIDSYSASACANAVHELERILRILPSLNVVAPEEELRRAASLLVLAKRVFELMAEESPQALVEFCRTDRRFIRTWGMPCHYAVFQKVP